MKKLFLLAGLAISAAAYCEPDHSGFTFTAGGSTLFLFSWPTGLVVSSTAISQDAAHKEAIIRIAAIEAAQVLDGAQPGPMLTALCRDNQSKSEDEIMDAVLEAAQSL